MDPLGHVNNVTYVDYLQEARVDMFRVHPPATRTETLTETLPETLGEGVVVARHEVEYLAPLVFRREPVAIEVWVTELRAASFTLGYQIVEESPQRRVYARARSVLTPYVFDGEHPRRLRDSERAVLQRFWEPAESPLRFAVRVGDPPPERHLVHPCVVRFSDVDAYRHVNNVSYLDYYQEARIELLDRLGVAIGEDPVGARNLVVARVDVDYRAPLLFRDEPYVARCWVEQVGGSSFTVVGQLCDPTGGSSTVLSRSRTVVVAFDPVTQRSTRLTEQQREALLAPLSPRR